MYTFTHTHTHTHNQVLKLYDYGNISDESVLHLASACPDMRQFSVPSCYSLSDAGIVGAVKHWHNITLLDVSRIPGITDGACACVYACVCVYVCFNTLAGKLVQPWMHAWLFYDAE